MTNQAPPPAAPPAWQPGSDPKAEAKAAKAYAKAQRPWYKKKRWIFSGVIVAIIVIASLSSGGGDKGAQDDKASDTPTAAVTNSQKEPSAAPSKAAVEADNSSAGKGAITWGNWEVVGKLQVTKEEFTDDFAVVTRVRNTSDNPDEGVFTVTILKNEEILGTATCTTSTVQPGAVGTANCISTDAFKPGHTEVTIEDAF